MLQESNGTICENPVVMNHNMVYNWERNNLVQSQNNLSEYFYDNYYYPYMTHWQSYPVYICTDKTKKAIEVLKALEKDGITQIVSVSKFIELVEKISNIL